MTASTLYRVLGMNMRHILIFDIFFSDDRLWQGNLKDQQKAEYIRRLQALSTLFPVWPPVTEVCSSARTVDVMEYLARNPDVMRGLRQPRWKIYDKSETNAEVIYKREGSTHGCHVLRGRDNPRNTILKDMMDTGMRWRWIAEERVRLLANAGQIRVFMSEGHLTHVVHTTRVGSRLVGTPVNSVLEAKDIRYVL